MTREEAIRIEASINPTWWLARDNRPLAGPYTRERAEKLASEVAAITSKRVYDGRLVTDLTPKKARWRAVEAGREALVGRGWPLYYVMLLAKYGDDIDEVLMSRGLGDFIPRCRAGRV